MSDDPLDIIDVASKQFVDQLVGLPKRVDTLESAIKTIKRVLSIQLALLLGLVGNILRIAVTSFFDRFMG
jgi:hypothetical protein